MRSCPPSRENIFFVIFLLFPLNFLISLPVFAEQTDFVLQGDGGIANQTGQNLDENSLLCQNLKPESWIGAEGGSQGKPSYLGLRLHGTQLPAGAKILSATLSLTNNRGREQKDTVSFELRAELNAVPAPFLCTQHAAQAVSPDNLPSARNATQAAVIHSETNAWPKGGVWEIDAAAPLQEAQQAGKLGETIVLLIRGTDTRLGKRYFFNHRQKGIDPATLPRLTVSYEISMPPPAPPVAGLIQISLAQSAAQITGSPGSVAGNAQVLITNTANNESVTVTAAPDGGFSASLPAAGGDTLTLAVKDAYGQASAGISLVVPPDTPPGVTPVHLSITYPPAGASLSSDFTRVLGTHDGPPNTGITLNGAPALVYNGQFAAIAPLQAGANSLNAVAFTLQGEAGQASVTVNSQAVSPALSLNASPRAGLAPLAVKFTYDFSGNAPFNFNFDFEGDGLADVTGTNADALPEHVYPAPGFYFPLLTLTDARGRIHRAETLVLAQDGAVMDAMFTEMWNGMNNALIVGNKEEAMKYLNSGAQRKYGPVFDVLMPHFAEIVSSYSPLQRASISQYIGEYLINRVINGRNKLFFIYFLQEGSGVWYLDAM